MLSDHEAGNHPACRRKRGAARVFGLVAMAILLHCGTASATPHISSSTPAAGPTTGGTVLTINGSGFSASGNAVTIGTSACPALGETPTRVLCTVPAGAGTNLAISIADALGEPSDNTGLFSYDAPSVSSITPTSGREIGGTRLTINGDNFGVQATAIVAGHDCPIDQQTHSSIECIVPAGTGTGVNVAVIVAGQVSNTKPFDYLGSPLVSSLEPTHASTAGGEPLTIHGDLFAASGNQVVVGGNSCPPTDQTPTRIVCTLPAGTGLDKSVQVTSDGAPSNIALFDYDGPLITSVEPQSGPTEGNVPITIRGQNFGAAGADSLRSVVVGTASCPLVPSASDHTEIQCTLPPGQGLGRTVVVTVDSQVGPASSIDYDAPRIDTIAPARLLVTGGFPITISGSNFGLDADVLVGGNDCPVTTQEHGSLVCTMPPGSGSGVALSVTVSGQLATSSISYAEIVCGDGYTDPGEVCDDHNLVDLDGCSAACETEDIQDKDQQACILALNKAGAGVAKAEAKDISDCARDAAAGVTCIGAANSVALDKALAKVATAFTKKCTSPPDFGPAVVADVQDAAMDEEIALARDIFGADADAALVPDALSPDRTRCQQAVRKAWEKVVAASLKSFGKCKKAGLKEGTIRSSSQLGLCLGYIDEDKNVDKPTAAQFSAFIDSCVGVDLAAAFPGDCAAAPNVADCVEDRVRCRTCRMLAATDNLDEDCDGYDDDVANASCP